MNRLKRRIGVLCAALGLILAALGLYTMQQGNAASGALQGYCVLIDPGHGGSDGGAVGAAGTEEAEVNLSIALQLKELLEGQGAEVVLTRSTDAAVGPTKNEDMRTRRTMIEEGGQQITVSIHQNSFPDRSVSGPQVLHAPGSEKGAALAACIQQQMNAELQPQKPRSIAAGDYYIVRSGQAPAVIVECGFLSNPTEEALLIKPAYQARVAKSIAKGIAQYLLKGQEEPL